MARQPTEKGATAPKFKTSLNRAVAPRRSKIKRGLLSRPPENEAKALEQINYFVKRDKKLLEMLAKV